nr:thiamine pyrophosphate-dependent enzyme [Treponema sp.]
GESLRGLLGRVEERRESEWTHRLEEWKKDRAPLRAFDRKGLSPRFVMEEAAARAGEEAFVATDVGQHQMWTAQFWPFTGPRRFASSGGLGTMGFGLGAAMGMQLGNPEARVVLVTGDGSFRMNMNELATVANYGLPIIILLMNNGTLGMVRQWQTMFYQRRYSQTSLDRGPDFQKLAAAFGIESWKAENEDGLRSALDAAFARRAPALIEVKIDIDETVLPMVPAGKPIADQIIEA